MCFCCRFFSLLLIHETIYLCASCLSGTGKWYHRIVLRLREVEYVRQEHALAMNSNKAHYFPIASLHPYLDLYSVRRESGYPGECDIVPELLLRKRFRSCWSCISYGRYRWCSYVFAEIEWCSWGLRFASVYCSFKLVPEPLTRERLGCVLRSFGDFGRAYARL